MMVRIKDYVTTSTNLKKEDLEWLDKIAKSLGTSRSNVLRQFIKILREYSNTPIGKPIMKKILRRLK